MTKFHKIWQNLTKFDKIWQKLEKIQFFLQIFKKIKIYTYLTCQIIKSGHPLSREGQKVAQNGSFLTPFKNHISYRISYKNHLF